jgi:hypothetical protein
MPCEWQGVTLGHAVGQALRTIADARCSLKRRSGGRVMKKKLGHTRGRRDSRNRCGREPDVGRRPMASPWLPSRPRCRRLGGRGPPWRRARSTKALLLRRLRVRARLFRAALLRPERTLLGRMALARSPSRGLLLTEARESAAIPAKKTRRPAMLGFFSPPADRSTA